MKKLLVFVFIVFTAPLNSHAASVFPIRPDDPRAVYLTPEHFAAGARGLAGSSAAIQSAIDKVEDSTVEGILFIPEGRYRITKTIYDGILTRKPSPAWQFTLIDSTFDGQREASIRENEAGSTLVHDEFRQTPTAVAVDPD